MGIVFKNNAKTTLASSLSNSATSATVTDGSVFPSLSAGEFFLITFDDGTNNEICKCTARSGNTLTIVRAQESTTARAFSSGDSAEGRVTAGVLEQIQENIAAKSANQTVFNTTTSGGATTYNIGTNPGVEANAMVFLNGVLQHHDTLSFSGTNLTFDAAPPNGMALEVIIDNLINLQSSNLTVDSFTAADVSGSPQTDFTLSDTPAAETNLIVFVDGVFQDQDAYTISSNTLTITTGVIAGRGVTVYVINPVNIGTPSDSTVTSAKLSGNITMPGNLIVASNDVAFDSPTFVVDHTNSRVGLGTASPSVPVDIVGDVKMSANLTVDTDTLVVDSSNNRVGVGTTSPDVTFEIADTNAYMHIDATNHAAVFIDRASTSYHNNVFYQTADTTNWRIGQMGADNILQVRDEVNDNSNVMVWKHGGNVGVGTINPSQRLTVESNSFPILQISNTLNNNPADAVALDLVEKQDGYAASTATFGQTGVYGYRLKLNGSTNDLILQGGSQTTVNDLIHIERDTGRVDLQKGNLYLTGSNDRRIKLSDSGQSGIVDSNNTVNVRGDNDFLKLNAAGNGGHILEINGVTKLDMRDNYAIFENTDGQVVVRDTAAGGNAGDGGYISLQGHHASASDGFREFGRIAGVKQNSTGGATQGDLRFYTNSGAVSATEKFRINAAGDLFAFNLAGSTANNPTLKINTGSGYIYYDSSSLRYKENIQDFGSALEKIKELRPVTYDDKALKVASFGLIAEEVNEIAPELVTYKEIDGEEKPETVVYDKLTIHLLKAMQEQQVIIDDLKARIETLEG